MPNAKTRLKRRPRPRRRQQPPQNETIPTHSLAHTPATARSNAGKVRCASQHFLHGSQLDVGRDQRWQPGIQSKANDSDAIL